MSGQGGEGEAVLRVIPRHCEVCRRENVPLKKTRGLFGLQPVERCVDYAACYAEFTTTPPEPHGGTQ